MQMGAIQQPQTKVVECPCTDIIFIYVTATHAITHRRRGGVVRIPADPSRAVVFLGIETLYH